MDLNDILNPRKGPDDKADEGPYRAPGTVKSAPPTSVTCSKCNTTTALAPGAPIPKMCMTCVAQYDADHARANAFRPPEPMSMGLSVQIGVLVMILAIVLAAYAAR